LVDVTLKTQRVRNSNFVNSARYTINGNDATVTGDTYVAELPTGTHSFKVDHPDLFTAYTSFWNPNTEAFAGTTDSSQTTANIQINGPTTLYGRKISEEQFNGMTHPNGDPASFDQIIHQVDSKTAPPEHQGTVRFQTSDVVLWFNRDDSNTTGPHEQYIKDWATETGDPSMHYFTHGNVQANSVQDGGPRPSGEHIEVLYDTTMAFPGSNGAARDGNKIEFVRVKLNPQFSNYDAAVILEELTEGISGMSDPKEFNTSIPFLVEDGIDHIRVVHTITVSD